VAPALNLASISSLVEKYDSWTLIPDSFSKPLAISGAR
jgi:hypothetical protein